MKNQCQLFFKCCLVLTLILITVQVGIAPSVFGASMPIVVNDPNEAAVPDGRNFKQLTMLSGASGLQATITFYAAPKFDEFFLYIHTTKAPGAEIVVRCRPAVFEIFKSTKHNGQYDLQLYTGTASIKGNNYKLTIPWKYIGVKTFKVWLYEMSYKDRLPDKGEIAVSK